MTILGWASPVRHFDDVIAGRAALSCADISFLVLDKSAANALALLFFVVRHANAHARASFAIIDVPPMQGRQPGLTSRK